MQRNNDPNRRPSNRSLQFWAGFWTVFWTLFFGVAFAVGYVFLSNLILGRPYGILSVLFFVLGCGLGLAFYLPGHFKVARKKRAEFVRAGGDPTGITPWMFGAMSGSITEDGVWEWYTSSGSSGESSAI
ncbi:hypothetical protein R5O87_19250 [Arthrobacter globiformis]|uniref:hypothetical protein n=1 Tax=Arthrobacter globiformis TaxID=1665 RepID=UPI00397C39C5